MQETLFNSYRLLDEAEMRTLLRCSRSSLYRLRKRGKLNCSATWVGRALFTPGESRRLIAMPLESQEAA